jgi:hypothetical protein
MKLPAAHFFQFSVALFTYAETPSFFLNTLIFCYSLQKTDQATHLLEMTGIIIILYIYTFLFVDSELLSFGAESFDFQLAIQKLKA